MEQNGLQAAPDWFKSFAGEPIVDRDPGDETRSEDGVLHTFGQLFVAWRELRQQVKALEETRDELADGLREMTVSRDTWLGKHQRCVELLVRRQHDLNRLGSELNEAWRRIEVTQGQRDQAIDALERVTDERDAARDQVNRLRRYRETIEDLPLGSLGRYA